jgi:lipoprotein signal peptidase
MLAFKSRRAWLVLFIVLALGVVTDLVSKSLAFEHIADQPVRTIRSEVEAAGPGRLYLLIPHHRPVVVVPRVLNFTLVYNPGAVFGIGAGQRWFFVLFTAAAMAAGLLYFAKGTRAGDRATHIGIALILSGGLGNLYDRLLFACVRDFIHPLPGMKLPFGLRWPNGGSDEVWPWISNLADLYLIIGVGIVLIVSFRGSRSSGPNPSSGK